MRDKKHGIKYPCELCNGAGWIVHQDPTKEPDVLPITKKMKKQLTKATGAEIEGSVEVVIE
ncbi:hypothetical protein KAR91_79935 [Candidatus Pacearchaeota archaeon]|nr:hypothetical protein [Candidatus Pacearchaeota archaeon]